MTRHLIAIIGLGIALLLLLLLSRFGGSNLGGDTVTVQLGFANSTPGRAQAVDEALLRVLETGHFNDELRTRLGHPPYQVDIAEFHADTCEVRQSDFERFAAWLKRNAPVDSYPEDMLRSSSTGHRIAGLLNSPASGVNYYGARAYCDALGGRLPWADEWEAMAVGLEGRLYPWGDVFDDAAWPYQYADRNAAQECGMHPSTDTPDGIHDLGGNVMEWSQGPRHAGQPKPGAHGAPAARPHGREIYALASAWLQIPPHTRSDHLGFRCVYDRPPSARTAWGGRTATRPVPSGEYQLGVPADLRLVQVAQVIPKSQQRQARALMRDQTPRTVRVGRCEVTREHYRAFLRHPLVRLGLFANEHEPRGQTYYPTDWLTQLENPELPVSGVNWWAADAFARWAGGRLPRQEEWQLFAASENANPYPWGDTYQAGDAATGDSPQPGLKRCGETTRDLSGSGLFDLGGNLSEWSASVTGDRGEFAAWVQGGNWLLPGDTTARSNFGRTVPLNHRSQSIGFRVIFD